MLPPETILPPVVDQLYVIPAPEEDNEPFKIKLFIVNCFNEENYNNRKSYKKYY